MKRQFGRIALVSAGLAVAATDAALAQGYGVYEHGTCAMGRAGTGVAAPCRDGSAVFYNPAGLVGRRGFDLTVGVTGIRAFGGFTNDTTLVKTGLANDIIPVPHVFARWGITEQLAAGIGLFVPYGLGTEWPLGFEGRFAGYDNDLRTFYIQPTVAYEVIPGVRVGAGLDIVQGKVELRQRVDLFEQEMNAVGLGTILLGQLGIPRNTEVADAHLTSDYATAVAGHFGVQVRLHERVSVGARYLTGTTLDYEGTVEFTQVPTGIVIPDATVFGVSGPLPLDTGVARLMAAGGPLATQGVATSLPMPAQFVAGFAVQVLDNLTFLADYQHTRWSAFDTLRIVFENGGEEVLAESYDNTNAVRGGIEWMPGTLGTLRGGMLWHEAAAPNQTVTPLLPEGRRLEFTIGYGRQLTDLVRVDAAYQYIRQEKRRGRMRNPLPGQDPLDLTAGLYEFNANLFGLTLNFSF